MAFSNEDRDWLDKKFEKVHDRITDSDTKNASLLNEQSVSLTAQIVASKDHCRALVDEHEDKKHSVGKLVAIVAGIVGAFATVLGGILWLIRNAPKG